MNSTHTALYWVWIVLLLANRAAFGQPAGAPRSLTTVTAAPGAPTVTILTAATGAPVRSHGAGSASLDLGRISYFKGSSVPGLHSQRRSRSLLISTRFSLKVDCPGSSRTSQVEVSMSLLEADPLHPIDIDGSRLGPAPQTLTPFMLCGSSGEHRLEVEVPASAPPGPLAINVAFLATLKK